MSGKELLSFLPESNCTSTTDSNILSILTLSTFHVPVSVFLAEMPVFFEAGPTFYCIFWDSKFQMSACWLQTTLPFHETLITVSGVPPRCSSPCSGYSWKYKQPLAKMECHPRRSWYSSQHTEGHLIVWRIFFLPWQKKGPLIELPQGFEGQRNKPTTSVQIQKFFTPNICLFCITFYFLLITHSLSFKLPFSS